mmetsp:Transcript_18326/g.47655  ORF Transcript_18326/g.47655 Transcript_18326/m.47655 type:complete len:214 (+) Transcript_18326:939-1580(+)
MAPSSLFRPRRVRLPLAGLAGLRRRPSSSAPGLLRGGRGEAEPARAQQRAPSESGRYGDQAREICQVTHSLGLPPGEAEIHLLAAGSVHLAGMRCGGFCAGARLGHIPLLLVFRALRTWPLPCSVDGWHGGSAAGPSAGDFTALVFQSEGLQGADVGPQPPLPGAAQPLGPSAGRPRGAALGALREPRAAACRCSARALIRGFARRRDERCRC